MPFKGRCAPDAATCSTCRVALVLLVHHTEVPCEAGTPLRNTFLLTLSMGYNAAPQAKRGSRRRAMPPCASTNEGRQPCPRDTCRLWCTAPCMRTGRDVGAVDACSDHQPAPCAQQRRPGAPCLPFLSCHIHPRDGVPCAQPSLAHPPCHARWPTLTRAASSQALPAHPPQCVAWQRRFKPTHLCHLVIRQRAQARDDVVQKQRQQLRRGRATRAGTGR